MTVRIINDDVLNALAGLPDESVDCCVTSPPYWGLRDYGVAGQIGLEATPGEHVDALVAVFREVRRVLRKTGVAWVNYGDCYASSVNGRSACDTKINGNDDRSFRDKPFSTVVSGLKPKDLVGMPWRLAFALQADGWWLRSDVIWSKPNPMPESIKDRPTKSHEYVFLLAKSERYYFDADAIREPATYAEPNSPQSIQSPYGQGFTRRAGKNEETGDRRKDGFNERYKSKRSGKYVRGDAGRDPAARTDVPPPGYVHESLLRNRRSVWTIATAPFPEAHFATFPPELAELCIKSGCPVGGTVLDPFGGAGTTGLVADRLQRNAILIELNPEYAAMAERRINRDRGDLLNLMEAAQ